MKKGCKVAQKTPLVKTVSFVENGLEEIKVLTQYWDCEGVLLLENSNVKSEANNMVETP